MDRQRHHCGQHPRLAWQRYINYSAQEAADSFDGSKLGWKNPIGSAPAIHFPQLAYSGYLTMATGGYTANRIFWPDQAYTISGSVSKTLNRHLLKFGTHDRRDAPEPLHVGLDLRQLQLRRRLHAAQPADLGHDLREQHRVVPARRRRPAATPTSTRRSSAVFRTYSLYAQDDIRLTSKLTLNLGLRWDRQTPITERWDRMIVGWDPNAKYTLGDATATGGFVFAKPGARTSWDAP